MNLNQIVQKTEAIGKEIIEKNLENKEISLEGQNPIQHKKKVNSKTNTQNSKAVHQEEKIQINKEEKNEKKISNKIIVNESIKEETQEKLIEIMQKESQRSKKSIKEEKKYEEKEMKKQESTFSFTGKPTEINIKLPRIEQNVIDSEKKLILTVWIIKVNEGLHLAINSQIIINAGGYVNSLRKACDGITYFGNEEQYNAELI